MCGVHFGWDFCICDHFFIPTIEVVTFWLSLRMVHARCVFVAGIHPSRTYMSRSFWVHVMECMCAQTRPQFILWSERVFGEWSLREKSPLPEKFSSEEDQTRDAASSRTASPAHCKLNYSSPETGNSMVRSRDCQLLRMVGSTEGNTASPCLGVSTVVKYVVYVHISSMFSYNFSYFI